MTLRQIIATFECEDCGCRFPVEIDPATTRPLKWSLFDIAEDALRGEVGMEYGRHRCVPCLRKQDDLHEVDCKNADCTGCRVAQDETAVGVPVAPETVARHGLRRSGETLNEYLLRSGIKKSWPRPSKSSRATKLQQDEGI